MAYYVNAQYGRKNQETHIKVQKATSKKILTAQITLEYCDK